MYMNSISITINIGEGLYPSASDFRFLSVRFLNTPSHFLHPPPQKNSTKPTVTRLAIFHLLDPLELHFGKPVFLPCRLGHLPSAKNHLKEVLQWTADIFFGPTSRRGWGRRCFFQNLLSVRFAEACFFLDKYPRPLVGLKGAQLFIKDFPSSDNPYGGCFVGVLEK